MKAFFKQIRLVFSSSYPSAYIPIKFWVWGWNKEGKVQYNNFKTLINYTLNKVK